MQASGGDESGDEVGDAVGFGVGEVEALASDEGAGGSEWFELTVRLGWRWIRWCSPALLRLR